MLSKLVQRQIQKSANDQTSLKSFKFLSCGKSCSPISNMLTKMVQTPPLPISAMPNTLIYFTLKFWDAFGNCEIFPMLDNDVASLQQHCNFSNFECQN